MQNTLSIIYAFCGCARVFCAIQKPLLFPKRKQHAMLESKFNVNRLKLVTLQVQLPYINLYNVKSNHWVLSMKQEDDQILIGMIEYVLSVQRILEMSFYYLFICKHELFVDLRSKFIPKYYTSNTTIDKMKGLLSLCNVPLLKNISLFISKLMLFFFLNYVFLVLIEIVLSLIASVPIYIVLLHFCIL